MLIYKAVYSKHARRKILCNFLVSFISLKGKTFMRRIKVFLTKLHAPMYYKQNYGLHVHTMSSCTQRTPHREGKKKYFALLCQLRPMVVCIKQLILLEICHVHFWTTTATREFQHFIFVTGIWGS